MLEPIYSHTSMLVIGLACLCAGMIVGYLLAYRTIERELEND